MVEDVGSETRELGNAILQARQRNQVIRKDTEDEGKQKVEAPTVKPCLQETRGLWSPGWAWLSLSAHKTQEQRPNSAQNDFCYLQPIESWIIYCSLLVWEIAIDLCIFCYKWPKKKKSFIIFNSFSFVIFRFTEINAFYCVYDDSIVP